MPQPRRRIIKVAKNCPFCHGGQELDYRDVATLSRYLSERARIIGRDRTGICAKHQRRLARQIKRARQMALLPFVSGL